LLLNSNSQFKRSFVFRFRDLGTNHPCSNLGTPALGARFRWQCLVFVFLPLISKPHPEASAHHSCTHLLVAMWGWHLKPRKNPQLWIEETSSESLGEIDMIIFSFLSPHCLDGRNWDSCNWTLELAWGLRNSLTFQLGEGVSWKHKGIEQSRLERAVEDPQILSVN
jgi:hypothetical protein